MTRIRNTFTVAIFTMFLTAPAFAEPPIKMLKASPVPPPEAQQIEKDAKANIPKPDERRLSVMEKKQLLQSMPGEREKLQKANAKAKGPMLKASTSPPPEAQQIEKEAKAKMPTPDAKKLSVGELKRALRANPAELHKVEKAEHGLKPTSGLSGEGGALLTWLNPFHVPEANATTTPVSMELNNGNHWYAYVNSSVSAYANMYGTNSGYYYTNPSMWHLYVGNGQFYDGYTDLRVNLASEGWYILDFYAGTGKMANLQHYESGVGYQQVAAWDFSRSVNYNNHYVTMQYLTPGNHYFHFNPVFKTNVYVMRINYISIDSWQ